MWNIGHCLNVANNDTHGLLGNMIYMEKESHIIKFLALSKSKEPFLCDPPVLIT